MRLSIKKKLFLTLGLYTLLVLGIVSFAFYHVTGSLKKHDVTGRNLLEIEKLSYLYRPITHAPDVKKNNMLRDRLHHVSHIQKFIVFDSFEKPVFTYCKKNVPNVFRDYFPEKTTMLVNPPNNYVIYPVYEGKRISGWVSVSSIAPLALHYEAGYESVIIIAVALIVILSLLCVTLLHRMISKPLVSLSSFVETITKTQCYTSRSESPSRDEIGLLSLEINNLLQTIIVKETQRDVAEAELRENEKRFRVMADLIPQPLLETDAHGNITYINKMGLFMFKMPSADFAKRMNIEMFVKTDVNLIDIARGESLLPTNYFFYDVTALTIMGDRIPSTIYYNPIIRNDVFEGIRAFIVDMSHHAKVEEELKHARNEIQTLLTSRQGFLTMLGSEIKTPIAKVIELTQSLSSDVMSAHDQRAIIQRIHSKCTHIQNSIQDIVALTKIESCELPVIKTKFDFKALLEEVQSAVSGENKLLENKMIQVSLVDESSPSVVIYADRLRLKEVLYNMFSNAITIADQGHIRCQYSMNTSRTMNTELVVSIEYPGDTIPVHYLDFASRGIEGVTLGNKTVSVGFLQKLLLSKRLVTLLGGVIWFNRQGQKYSSFCFSLPVGLVQDDSESTITDALPSAPVVDWTGKKILVAEDEVLNFEFIKIALEETNIMIEWAQNGKEAVQKIKDGGSYDAVIMDIRMPVMNGIEATRQIRKLKGDFIPIIVQTAYALGDDKKECFEAGCTEYITKPILQKKLIEAISRNMKDFNKN